MGKIYDFAVTGVSPVVDWIREYRRRRKNKKRKYGDAIEDISRLHELLKAGVITQDDFDELKEKLKGQIG